MTAEEALQKYGIVALPHFLIQKYYAYPSVEDRELVMKEFNNHRPAILARFGPDLVQFIEKKVFQKK